MAPTCETVGPNNTGVVNADSILYVSAVTTTTCLAGGSGALTTTAFAAVCQLEASLDR